MAKGAQVEPDKDTAPKAPPPADPPSEERELPPRLARRAQIMDGIHEARREMLRQGGVDVDADEDDAEAEPDTEPSPADKKARPPEKGEPGDREEDEEEGQDEGEGEDDAAAVKEPGDEPPAQKAAPVEPKVKVVIDGQEQELPLSEVVAGYQVRATADRRLQIANKTLADAEELRDRLTRGDAGDGPRPSERDGAGGDARTTGQPKAKSLDSIDWAKLGKDLQYEDPENAGNALRTAVEQIITMGADPSATRDELESQILDKIEWQQALDRFRTEYKDVVDDPVLKQVAGNFGNALWAAAADHASKTGATRPAYWDIWDQAGKATKDWLAKKTQGDADLDKNPNTASPGSKPKVSIDPDRAERKRAAAQPPEPRTPQVRRERETPPANSEQSLLATRQKAISEMQETRGQARYRG